ncbi:MAG: hypothetical protein PF630_11690 [Gammaproteobacteria bacterium]|jgi:hypothetical protein|nr:hypothetical protein [Gammaproteobacteria bacterium]
MNIDEKIRQQLESEQIDVDSILADEKGLFSMLLRVYRGNLAGWTILMTVVTFMIFVVAVYCGYQFVTLESAADKIHWGLFMLMAVIAVGLSKLWLFMEMNRASLQREIKRVEIAVLRLQESIGKQ